MKPWTDEELAYREDLERDSRLHHKVPRDVNGVELKLGDKVIWTQSGRHSSINVGRIVKITPPPANGYGYWKWKLNVEDEDGNVSFNVSDNKRRMLHP